MSASPGERRRLRARVEGTVQGVGFRPHVYRLVGEHGLAGWVQNDERGVVLEVEGEASALDLFLARLVAEAPPLAAVERVRRSAIPALGESGFRILASSAGGAAAAQVSPDGATCDACLAELFDPADRRFRYPFINCTHCGPRFTIVRGVPYDRPRTTMASFPMCAACKKEYENPADRRFHAQPIACPDCGPRLALTDREGRETATGDAALTAAAAALIAGRIVAVKGLGGFHLACRADDEAAVAALRGRKRREDKPFALMVGDLAGARRLVDVGAEEEALLVSRSRPIVLAPRHLDAAVATAVAPGAPELGLMLPYTPLHHLLLRETGTALVMTSGNLSDEPIVYRDDDARERLGEIADLFLGNDRPIHMRTDDSVARVVALAPPGTEGPRRTLLLRRSRGWVPAPLALPAAERPLLACGADLKGAFCVAKGGSAWMSHHIGDLEEYETWRSYVEGVEHFERLFAVAPEVIAHDLHPDYRSTAYAREREERAGERGEPVPRLVAVQHHHAHLAAVLAEHGEEGPAVGVIFDGTGYGTDGAVWGGELLVGGLAGFERAGHLWPVRLPGGDRAAREPWRMACAWLVADGEGGEDGGAPAMPAAFAGRVDDERWRAVAHLAATGLSAPWTTSIGRLFDAVAALCGIRLETTYEGQAAIELEAAAEPEEAGAYPLPLVEGAAPEGGNPAPEGGTGALLLDARETVLAVARDAAAGVPAATVSARFHNTLAEATVRAAARIAEWRGLDTVVLSGGVFQNRRLLEAVAQQLTAAGLRVLVPEMLPPNDGGIAFGQAAIAATELDRLQSSQGRQRSGGGSGSDPKA